VSPFFWSWLADPRFWGVKPVGIAFGATVGLLIGAGAMLASGVSWAQKSPKHKERGQFDAILEPSGVVQLPDGRIVVVEDSKRRSVSILELKKKPAKSALPARKKTLVPASGLMFGKVFLNDLEAVAVDRRGFVYAITSFSRNIYGYRNPRREKLLRFSVGEGQVSTTRVLTGLGAAMAGIDTRLASAANVRKVDQENGFNVEGLSFDSTGDKLYLGLRGPVIDGKGVVIVMENPIAAFENGEPPVFASQPIFLDLDKGGIRALAYDPRLKGFLILSRQQKRGKKFKLWLWSGEPGRKPRRIRLKGKYSLAKAEGITPIRVNGEDQIMIVFDTGIKAQKTKGQYLRLSYDQLMIDPIVTAGK